MKAFSIIVISILIFPFHSLSQRADNTVPEKGKVIQSVTCSSNPKYSYSLFLPLNYSGFSAWPVIFVFDPAGKGSLGVEGFARAAAKYGYIVAGSNNSKNQLPGAELSEAVNSMFSDVEAKFSIDHRRVYTAGFSGGARVASMIAMQTGIITGVIACGAGLPNEEGLDKAPQFAFFGIVGTHDMNYIEMYDLGNKLYETGARSYILTFEGGHAWPSADLLEKAVGWMEIQAMNTGIEKRNTEFTDLNFTKELQKAKQLLTKGSLIESARCYEYLTRDYPGRKELPTIKRTIDSLKRTTGYSKALRDVEKDRSWEQQMQNKMANILFARVREESLPDTARDRWTAQASMLRDLEKKGTPSQRAMASRIIMLSSTMCYETGKNMTASNKNSVSLICFRLGALIDPGNNEMQFQLAKTWAINGKNTESLSALEVAIKSGYKNKKSIETDPAFAGIRSQKRYNELLSLIK